ncbi:PAS domain S-box protein [Paenibacillus aurantius]|uniref:histidine kinase n=1 Tax=Paenibacillus aurantius TaxID=2918900 RepID=A0AA96LEB8_9BACL|nr:PAS domain S-box protein [Paenibacillus aurantius]WNQ12141.1 PAS domain S-box protein [Paenibacillus aurantius]
MEERKCRADVHNQGESLIEKAFRYASFGMAVASLEGDVLEVNPSLCRMLGYSEQEIIKLNFTSLTYQEDFPIDVYYILLMGKGKQDFHQTEKRFHHKDGTTVWALMTVSLVRDDKGTGTGFLVQLLDITQQKLEGNRTRPGAQPAPERKWGGWEVNLGESRVYWSQGMYDLLKMPMDNEPPAGYGEKYVHPEDWEWVLRSFKEAVAGVPCRIQYRLIRPDGTVRTVVTKAEAVLNESGKPVKLVGTTEDVTDHYQYDEELRQSVELYNLISEHAQELISFVSADDGILRYISPSVRTLLGYDAGEVVGTRAILYVHPDDVWLLQEFQRQEGNPAAPLTYRVRHKDGHYIWFETNLRKIRSFKGEVDKILTIGRDVTESRQTQEMLRNSEKLSIAGELAAGIAHEIRNPLTAIKGFVRLMQTSGAKAGYLDIITSELNRIESIVGELLVLSKPREAKFSRQDLIRLLEHVVSFIETQAIMNNVILIKQFNFLSRVYINGDDNQIKQVFINLLKNGIEAMPQGGEILIDVRLEEGMVAVSLTDQGVGIPPDKLAKVGSLFYTTKENGTGLGMMVSHKIIQDHRGTLHLTSQVGLGTTVTVRLPLMG